MPKTDLADKIHAKGYRTEGDSFRDWAGRFAGTFKDSDAHFEELYPAVHEQRILPAGRVQAAGGTSRRVTAANCFVMRTIPDNLTGIFDVCKEGALTMQMGGGTGYDFSPIRPRGANISTVQAPASGAVSFMGVYDAMCWTIMSAGARRGAMMGCLRIDHPDIEEFIAAKQNRDRLTGFNVSVTVPHDFMRAEGFDAPWELKHEGRVFSSVSSRSLWEQVMRSAWDWSEPGVIFIDRVNEMNNLWYCEEIAATNPCAEQPLPPEGACILSSLNLTKYVRSPSALDWDLLARDVATAIRMLDTVIERTHFPLHSQMHEAHSKRRVGLGVTGLANALEAMGAPYGSPMFLDFEERLLAFIRDRAYTESAVMAAEKGPFRLFDRDKYLDGRFIRTLPPAVRDLIAQNGIRNSHLLSIAPTGTISLCADNVSSGVEPVFSYRQERRIRWNDKQEVHLLKDYGLEEFGVYGKTMAECTVDDHLNVLSTAQRYVDSAVSKTVNTSPSIDWAGFKDIYRRAWEAGCKSLAVHKPEHNRDDVIRSCDVDPETGISTCEA